MHDEHYWHTLRFVVESDKLFSLQILLLIFILYFLITGNDRYVDYRTVVEMKENV